VNTACDQLNLVHDQIESHRQMMNQIGEQLGISHSEVLSLSMKLDALILKYMQLKRQILKS
jgi:Spo0E like sporulation regulatory protein